MKKIFFLLFALAGITGAAGAQAVKTNVNTKSKVTTVSGAGVSTTKTHVISNGGVNKTKVSTTTRSRPVATVTAKGNAKPVGAASPKLKQDGTPDKRYKSNSGLKKDGTPDKRYKSNKRA